MSGRRTEHTRTGAATRDIRAIFLDAGAVATIIHEFAALPLGGSPGGDPDVEVSGVSAAACGVLTQWTLLVNADRVGAR